MSPQELESVGQALYGKRWKSAMARALDIDVVTIWRYVTGQQEIPRTVELAVRYLQLSAARPGPRSGR